MPGPLPNPQARRRNAPTIPTTQLPAGGLRDGKGRRKSAPACPYDLGQSGSKWWAWAWALPQAAAWDAGALYVIARRAQLEDEAAAVAVVDGMDLGDLLGISCDEERVGRLEALISQLRSRVSGSTTLMREMRELDNRLGLNPKAMADLRWSIVPDEAEGERPAVAEAPRRLRAV